jgi:hypothetical protein
MYKLRRDYERVDTRSPESGNILLFNINIHMRLRLVFSLETTDINKVTIKRQTLTRFNSFVVLQNPTLQQFLAFII